MMSKHEKQTILNWVESADIDRKLMLKARRKIQKQLDTINSLIASQGTRLQKLETFVENS